jgi:hypothetical protein
MEIFEQICIYYESPHQLGQLKKFFNNQAPINIIEEVDIRNNPFDPPTIDEFILDSLFSV